MSRKSAGSMTWSPPGYGNSLSFEGRGCYTFFMSAGAPFKAFSLRKGGPKGAGESREGRWPVQVWILSICPQILGGLLASPLIERGRQRGNFVVHVVDLRDLVEGCYRKVDDSPYGGGAGMVLRCEPVARALGQLRGQAPGLHAVSLTPSGKPYTQADARRLARLESLALVCGHYEGMDERIASLVQEEISIGDYVLSGGEIPAMVVADSLSRLMEGALKRGSLLEEAFDEDRLEYPQYTRPAVFEGMAVPEVLLSGHHENIERYRRQQALLRTWERRRDLLERRPLSREEWLLLWEVLPQEERERLEREKALESLE